MSERGGQDTFRVFLRFDPDFQLFLDPGVAGRFIEKRMGHATTLKDLVESCGVPHTEIGALLLNGSDSAIFTTRISDGDRIEVLPIVYGRPDMRCLQPVPPETAGFIADIHLGRAARRLRLLGFDTRWFTGKQDTELLDLMEREGRILLTRDRRLLMHNRVALGCCVRSDSIVEQVVQVVLRYGLAARVRPFSRCLACNGILESSPKETVNASLQEKTRRYYEEFSVCRSCGKVYWKGAHTARLSSFVETVLSQAGGHSVL